MRPVGIVRGRKGFQILHQCTGCDKRQPNRVALDTVQDDFEALLALMVSRA
jgi:hypothetical protein